MSSTIRDVAGRACVSIATVSKFINGGIVREDNRISIENAILELNFQVNTVARGMKTRKSMTAGVLLPKIADPVQASIVAAVESELYAIGYSTIICGYSDKDQKSAQQKLEFLLNMQVDGIIMQAGDFEGIHFECVQRKKTPVVFVGGKVSGTDYDSIAVDDMDISDRTIRHLIDFGHKRIGIISGAKDTCKDDGHAAGYRKALDTAGISFEPELMYLENDSEKSGYEGMRYFSGLVSPPTAVFAAESDVTAGALLFINEKGFKIPEDLSFIGYENRTIARIWGPSLTTAVSPIKEIGQAAVEMLAGRMNGTYTKEGRNVMMKASINFGASVAGPGEIY